MLYISHLINERNLRASLMMKLSEVLTPELIKCPLTGVNKVDVIIELITILSEHNIVFDKDEVLEAVMERERVMTTGVGNGVAIPHCKTPHIEPFVLAMGIHYKCVDFKSLDHKPAHIFFLLIGPENKPGIHIRLLSRISRIIAKDGVRQQLMNQKTPEEIHRFLVEQESQSF